MNDSSNTNNLELASISSRILAFIIDDIIINVIIVIVFWESISLNKGDTQSLVILMNQFVWPMLCLKFVYQTFFIWYYGATIGKIVAKIRVIDYNHFGKITLMSSIIRSFGRIISEMFFYIGFIFAFFTDGKQTLHDKIGRTLVVNV
jgi:uncharacterized RDD family membrane protein YckC